MKKLLLKLSAWILAYAAIVAAGTFYVLPRLMEGKNLGAIIGLWLAFVLAPMALSAAVWFIFRKRRKREIKRLLKEGVRAQAAVLSVKDTGVTLNQILFGLDLNLRVEPPMGPPFECKISTFVPRISIPQPGDMLTLAYDPRDKSKIVLTDPSFRSSPF